MIHNTDKPCPGELLDALHAVQAEHGYVPRQEAFAVSKRLGVPLAQILEVLTFYSYFRLEAPGKVTISICDGTSCHLQKSLEILAELERTLGIKAGETTSDGRFFLDVVRCLGCCARSPVIMVDDRVFSEVKVADIPAIISIYAQADAEEAAGDGTP